MHHSVRLCELSPPAAHVHALRHHDSSCRCTVGRTYGSDAETTRLLCEMLEQYGWRAFSVMHSNDEFANNYAEGLRTNSALKGLRVQESRGAREASPGSCLLGHALRGGVVAGTAAHTWPWPP